MSLKNSPCSQPAAIAASQDIILYRQTFSTIAHNQPLTLLIEGGSGIDRFNAALFWAMLSNCPSKTDNAPCMECAVCKQIMAQEHQDILIYDGRISNRADEETPGNIRALSMENMRALKSLLGVEPRNAKKRVAIIDGMTTIREEALNSLLKVLEEPAPQTLFVLLAPLREQILPTLVSRSICVTLPWNMAKSTEIPLQNELGVFLNTGKGFLSTIAQKGALENQIAESLLLACQRSLLSAYQVKTSNTALDQFFTNISKNPSLSVQTQFWINEAMEMLVLGVNPARCLEGFATRLHMAAHFSSQQAFSAG